MNRVAAHPIRWALAMLAAGIVLGGTTYSFAEPDISMPDGWWWAFVSMTTVGYGDLAPRTDAIRCIAVFVIVTGIAATAILTATLAGRIAELRLRPWNDTPELDDDIAHAVEVLASVQTKINHPRVRAALREAHEEGNAPDAS